MVCKPTIAGSARTPKSLGGKFSCRGDSPRVDSGPRRKFSRIPSLVFNALLMGLAFGLLASAMHHNQREIVDVFRRGVDGRLIAAAILCYMTAIVLSFVRWSVLVRVIEPRFTLRDALLLGFVGNVFNLVIPGGIGGDLVKAAYLTKMDIRRTQAIATMAIDRLLGLLGLSLLAAAAGVIAWPLAGRPIRFLIVLVWAASLAGVLLLLAISHGPTRLVSSSATRVRNCRIARFLSELGVLSEIYSGRPGLVKIILAWCCGIHGLFVAAFYLAGLALFPAGLPGFVSHLLIVPLVLFSTALPLPFGALGLSEHVSENLFDLVGHPGGMLSMVTFRILIYVGGVISLLIYAVNIRHFRSLALAVEMRDEEISEGAGS